MGLLVGVGKTKPEFPYDYYYGIEWDITVSNPKCTRIGKIELHKSLPIQSKMRRCLLNDDGTINYYLHANDSTKRDNGADAVLDGSHGQVMVEIPDMYVRFEMDGNKRRCMMSEYPLPGFHKWSKSYISAYEATIQRSTLILSSVVNKSTDYRGGTNKSSWDDSYRSLLGMPATSIYMSAFRGYARKRGSPNWNCISYTERKKIWWLFVVEYATLNSQVSFNSELTADGYKQGGLGNGVAELNMSKWWTYNEHNPFIPCGTTNTLGNNSGVIPFQMPDEYDATITILNVPSYRGLENPFGHLWEYVDGHRLLISSNSDGGISQLYVCDDPSKYSSNISEYDLKGVIARDSGFVKEIVLGEHGEVLPIAIGGGSTTFFCDYFYNEKIPESGTVERMCIYGGNAYSGNSSGFMACSVSEISLLRADIGTRLCYIPTI